MSAYLYPAVVPAEEKRARAKRLWAVMTNGENAAGRKKRYRDIWTAILQAEQINKLPHHLKIQAAPRVRGVGYAAARAVY